MRTIILDCHFLCHRAKHSYCDVTDMQDRSGVIFGFLKQVMDMAKRFETNQFIFCWDSSVSKREKEFPEYKQKRNEHKNELTPEEIEFNNRCFKQFDHLRTDILKRIGFRNIFIQPWYETDDLAAKIVMERDDRDFIIATRDQDFWQLLSYCDLYDPQTKYLLTEEAFVREWGIHPSKWAEVKSIAGCKSDNVPGIYGVGEKTAVKYITKKLKPHTKKFKDIERNKDVIKRNRRLVTLPFPGTKLYTLQEDQFDFDSFYSICNQLAMDYFLQRRQLNWWRAFFEGYGYDSEPCRTRPRAFA